MLSQAEFLKMLLTTNMFVSFIWKIPGFRLDFIRPDWMHVVDLGIAPTCVGSVLWCCFKHLGGTIKNWKKACSMLYSLLKFAAEILGVDLPIQFLTIGMFRAQLSKKCSAKLKAAECRYIVPILLTMFDMHFKNEGEHEMQIFHCLDALNDCYVELNRWVDGESGGKLAAHGRKHVLLFGELCKESTDYGYWQLQPKHHIFIHLVENSKTNPKKEWNYMDEDAIGHGARQARWQDVPNFNTAWIRRRRLLFRFDPDEARHIVRSERVR